MKEEELFQPIKAYFQEFGYTVDGEVGHLDALCEKNGQFIAIELKNELNFKVFMQAAKQQKLFEHVFIGCWTPKNIRSRAFQDKLYLLHRLGLGLILVSTRTKEATVFCEPIVHSLNDYKQRNKRKKEHIVQEFTLRKTRSNSGGVHKKKLMTAYRENCLLVVGYLYAHGPSKAATIKKDIWVNNAYTILYQNHHGWFERIENEKGLYALSQQGIEVYYEQQNLIEQLDTINQSQHQPSVHIEEN